MHNPRLDLSKNVSLPDFNPSEGGTNSIKGLEGSAAPRAGAEMQLSQPQDVQAAHNFFQPGAGSASTLPDISLGSSSFQFADSGSSIGLPDLSIGNTGAEHLGLLDAGASSLPGMSGAEAVMPSGAEAASAKVGAALMKGIGLEAGLFPGLEQGALAGLPPGAEPISPMIQMILKMPGGLGLIGSFFEILGSLLFPTDGGLLMLFDPAFWAGAAQQAFGAFAGLIGGAIPFNITLFGSNSGMLQTLFQQNLMDAGKSLGQSTGSINIAQGLEGGSQSLGCQALEINGSLDPSKPMFETGALDGNSLSTQGSMHFASDNRFLAMEGSNSFGPTISSGTGSSVSVSQSPATDPGTGSSLSTQSYSTSGSTPGSGSTSSGAESQGMDASGSDSSFSAEQGSLLQDNAAGAQQAQQSMYTIKTGDNLWNIARDHLGSGSRWNEIFELNTDVIGQNPDLIFSGTELKLPSGESLAGANDYIVKSGDNLWNIARDHMGGGKNWTAIYDGNSNVIGANPDLIRPGQHLSLPEHGQANMQLAHNQASSHAGSQTGSHTSQHHQANSGSHAKTASTSSTNHLKARADAGISPRSGADASPSTSEHIPELPDNPSDFTRQISDLGTTGEAPRIAQAAQASAALDKESGLRAVAKSL